MCMDFALSSGCCGRVPVAMSHYRSIRLDQIPSFTSTSHLRLSVEPKKVFFFQSLGSFLRDIFHSSTMPRRPPPTPLQLFHGPLPPRGQPKFTLPSVPRPIFHPPSVIARGPVSRERVHPVGRRTSIAESGEGPQESPSPLTSSSVGKMRGPWDHSRSMSSVIGRVVAPPKAAV